MHKFIQLLSAVLPLGKKLLFPNGKFDKERAVIIIVLFVIIATGIQVFGFDTISATTEILTPIVELIGTSD
ncbi:hypothetical protein [Vibrio phage PhiImVa-1]|nr:hypothetical protein [Vibrio phage PhiImVa-1]